MNALVKKQQAGEGTTVDSSALLSLELLNSLLIRFKMVMDERFREQKPLIRSFLVEKNLNFLQKHCATKVQELVQLVVFYNLSLNFLSESLNLDNINLVQFMFEMKQRQIAEPATAEFLLFLWKSLKNC